MGGFLTSTLALSLLRNALRAYYRRMFNTCVSKGRLRRSYKDMRARSHTQITSPSFPFRSLLLGAPSARGLELGGLRFGMFYHSALLLSQFCRNAICFSKISQIRELPRSKSTQSIPNQGPRADRSPCMRLSKATLGLAQQCKI